jgi:hypothetical protein
MIREYSSPDVLHDEDQLRSTVQGEAKVATKAGPEDVRSFGQE